MAESDRVTANIAAYWNERSATYDDDPDHRVRSGAEHAAWLAALRDLLPAPPAEVLDVGTGTGFLAVLLAELGYGVTGVDIAEQMLAVARAKAASLDRPPVFLVGDAVAPPVSPASMDGIVSRHVLWTLPDPPQALANWRRILRPGGRLVVIDGLWSVGATPPDPATAPTPAQLAYATYYTPEVTARLPLLTAQTLDDVLAAIIQAGFSDARVSRLEALEYLEQAAGDRTHPGRYIVTAARPVA